MAGTTSVDVQGMLSAQGDFENALEQCNTAYQDMEEQQATLMANWSGEAASAFGQALSSYLEDLNTVRSGLRDIVEVLSSNTRVYSNTDEGSSQLANAFATGLPGLSGM